MIVKNLEIWQMKNQTQNLTLSSLFIALGILIPILFHAIGLGSMMLPMFWPITVGAFFLAVPYAAAVGVLTPVLSALMTGMPPPPILYKMIFELVFLGISISFGYRKTRLGIFWLVLAGMLISRIMALLGSAAIAPLLGLPPEFYALISLLKGTPGMIVIVVLMPLIVSRLMPDPIFSMRKIDVQSPSRILQ